MIFAVVLARTMSVASIHSYLSSVRAHHIEVLGAFSWDNCYRLPRLLKGIKRRQHRTPRHRDPVTLSHLLYWKSFFDFENGDHCTLWAALLAAFFGLLRISEFTVAGGRFDPKYHLTIGDLTWLSWPHSNHPNPHRPDGYELFLSHSKTDVDFQGVAIPISANDGPLCPVAAMMLVAGARACVSPMEPLFMLSDGPLTRRKFCTLLRSLVLATPVMAGQSSGSKILSHSLRIGGVAALQAAGASELVTQLAGRWRSDAYKDYLRRSTPQLLEWNRRMAVAPCALTIPPPPHQHWPTSLNAISACTYRQYLAELDPDTMDEPARPVCVCPECHHAVAVISPLE